MCENWVTTLRLDGYGDVRSVKQLRSEGAIQKGHHSVLDYAYENGMVLVTGKSKLGGHPAMRKIRIVRPDTHLFEVVLKKLVGYGNPTKEVDGATSSTKSVKVIVDEMYDRWDYKLRIAGYDAYSVKKIIRHSEGEVGDDYSMITYAREKGMIIVTNDGRVGQDCKKAGIPCILLDDEDRYNIVKEQLAEMGGSEQAQA